MKKLPLATVASAAVAICVALIWQHAPSTSADADAGLPPAVSVMPTPATPPSAAPRAAARPKATTPVPRLRAEPRLRRLGVSRGASRVRHHQRVRHLRFQQAHSPRQRQGFRVWGVDVSKWQHPHPRRGMNWRSLARTAPGFGFTFVKGSAGGSPLREANPWHRRDAVAARAAGAYVGSYHYASPSRPAAFDARREARKAVRASGAPRAGDLPMVLDLESNPEHLSRRLMAGWALAWLGEVERLTGRTPIVYTYASFFSSSVAPRPSFRHYPLWIAHYGSTVKRPTVPRPWSRWTFWQHSSQGHLPGTTTDVDLNVFAGTKRDLARLADA